MAVTPSPEGFHTITPDLVCRGAAKAIAFYEKVFGARVIDKMEMPGGKIGHAYLQIGSSPLFLADEFPEWGSAFPESIGGSPVVIHLYVDDVDAIWKKAIDAGVVVEMPLENMFWGDRDGKIKDPFGHRWSLATHVEDVTPDEMAARQKKMSEKK